MRRLGCVVLMLCPVLGVACHKHGETSDASVGDASVGDAGGLDAASAGDGSTSPFETDYLSGTRLRAKIYKTANGARMFHGWYDSQLQQDCVVQTAADGNSYCLPQNAPKPVFLDAGCTMTAFVQSTSAPAITEAAVPSSSACTISTFSLGPAQSVTSYYAGSPALCVHQTFTTPVSLYPSTGAVPTSSYVQETLTPEARGALLSMKFWVGTDGSRQPIGPFDVTRQTSCGLTGPSSLVTNVCIPSWDAPIYPGFADTSCTVPVAEQIGCPTAEQSKFALSSGSAADDKCHFITNGINPLGNLVTQLYWSGNVCMASVATPPRLYSLGATIPLTDLPALTLWLNGAGQILEQWLASPTSEKIDVISFYDTNLSLSCMPLIVGDGSLRCAPTYAPNGYEQAGAGFSDAQCTHPVYSSTPIIAGCAAEPPKAAFSYKYEIAATAGSRVFISPGTKTSAPAALYSVDTTGKCVSASLPTDPTTVWWNVSEVLPAQLAALSDVVE